MSWIQLTPSEPPVRRTEAALNRRQRMPLLAATIIGITTFPAFAAAPAASLDREFGSEIRPLLQQYCLGCHSTEKHKGDMDLERFATFSDVMKHPKPWQQ